VLDLRVVDRTTGIAGPYCTRLLADAGADVVKVEPDDGDPLRRWRSGGLFEFLNASKRSVTGGHDELLARADVVVTERPEDVAPLRAAHRHLVVVSVTPFGCTGPYADRPATEFTLQALSGSTASRGLPERSPLPAGGRLGEWVAGVNAAAGALAAARQARADGQGRHVDVAVLDCMAISMVIFPTLMASFFGPGSSIGATRSTEVPSVEPTTDGYVNFTCNSAQQFQDFLLLIGHPELQGDPELANPGRRFLIRERFLATVHEYTAVRSTDTVLEEAGLLRIPSGPVLDGSRVTEFEQFVERGVYERAPSGRFRQPRAPYSVGGTDRSPRRPSPEVGADTGSVAWPTRDHRAAGPSSGRPLEGIRVIDLTAWWAGPAASHALACLGADVIKVEATTRPDGVRFASARRPDVDQWWEWSWIFHSVNSSKRGVTLDLTRPEGVEVLERLLRTADVLIENFTPRVMEHFGLGWERVHEVNPRLIMVRMPAFGLTGPWRDRTGFAQTMEAMSGMAWVTGYPDGPPMLPRGVCDPLGAMHAVVATLVALEARDADGQGRAVESVMIEAALNVTAEQVIEYDLTGAVLGRQGARGPDAAPQGVYRCSGEDRWVAVAVEDDGQWDALRQLAGWADDPRFSSAQGRVAHHDELDRLLEGWLAHQEAPQAADRLAAAGVPAGALVLGRDLVDQPQLAYRGLFERLDHPVTGNHPLPGLPFRMEGVDRWLTCPSPTLGQHNDEVLGEVASPAELEELRAAGLVGEWPAGL